MNICDLIDIRFSQFRAFKAVVRKGCLDAGIRHRDIVQEGPGLIDDVQSEDIVLAPPYGAFINRMRNEPLSMGNPTLLVDLKGPMGIDSFLQLALKIPGSQLHYCSPMLAEARYRDCFQCFPRMAAHCHPLPFFPHPNQIEQVGILDRFSAGDSSAVQKKKHVFFAGAVWGYRERCLQALSAHDVPVCVREGLSPKAYWEELWHSAIALDMGGGQAHTYRLHEIYLAGGCCVAEHRPICFLSGSPRDQKEIVWFRSIPELIEKVRMLLCDAPFLETVSATGSRWYRNTQSPARLVDYLVGIASNCDPPLRPVCRDGRYCYDLDS